MMDEPAISVVRLSKEYRIGSLQPISDRLGEQLADALVSPFRRTWKLLRGEPTAAAELDEKIWALHEVSFEIKHGEVVGIIGQNGAGKSTLLKILSRITEPTSGYIDLCGRVGSLLEVGTGFHPELTGRENIFLNGAILGMKKGEIRRKFDEIIAFAEIEKFVDTPVKHYSSGMYVRLAFSVAAHLEPEILLVDEVLAVGDLAFQRKCLGKMDNVARQGRTVIFVSHNMGLVQSLCQRGILLREGVVLADGPIAEVVDTYLRMHQQANSQPLSERSHRRGLGQLKATGVEIVGLSDGEESALKSGGAVRFVVQLDGVCPGMACTLLIYDLMGQPVARFASKEGGPDDLQDPKIERQFVCEVNQLLLLPGRYRLDIAITGDNRLQDYVEAALTFDVGSGNVGGRFAQPNKRFSVCLPHRWILPARNTVEAK